MSMFLKVLIAISACVLAFVLYKKFRGNNSGKISFKTDSTRDAEEFSAGDVTRPVDQNSRLKFLGFGIFGVFSLLTGRLWMMQLVSNDEYSKKAELNRTRTIKTPAQRGRILDRNGVALVDNRPSLTVVALPEVVENPIQMRMVANVLGMPYQAVRRKVQDQTEGAQSARTIAWDATQRQVAFLGEHNDFFPGIAVEKRTQRHYPYGALAAHVLGYTGPVTQEQLKVAKENHASDQVSYSIGDIVGQAGVELEYESVLQGVRGEQIVYVDADGKVTDYSAKVPSQPGSDIVLTLDKSIQKECEKALALGIKKAQSLGFTDCKSGACIVLDARDGGVVACASAPTFNPGIFVGGISTTDWDRISSKSSGYPLMNKAISGQFMAASTIKPLSVFAAMDFGVADPSSSYYCTGFWTGMGKAYGKYCWKHEGHGSMSLQTGITHSCDVVFYEIAKSLFNSKNKEGLQQTFRRWGLGNYTGIDLPSEAKGLIPDAKWKWDTFTSSPDSDRVWQGGDTANIAIGQGDVLVTCLQMAQVYLGIANKGNIWKPHVMRSIQSQTSEGTVIDYKPVISLEPKQTDEEYNVVDAGLLGVTTDPEFGLADLFSKLDVSVLGKTGTGERLQGESTTAWFCCFAPSENPRYAVACVLDNGGEGSQTAVYTVFDTLKALFNSKDTSKEE